MELLSLTKQQDNPQFIIQMAHKFYNRSIRTYFRLGPEHFKLIMDAADCLQMARNACSQYLIQKAVRVLL